MSELDIGLHHNITFEDYLRIDALNQSTLKEGLRSMAHLRAAMERPREPSPSMQLGTLVHACQLEPERLSDLYAVFDDEGLCAEIGGAKPRSTKAYKERRAAFLAANVGKELVTVDDFIKASNMVRALAAHPVAKRLFSRQGNTEAVAVWRDPITDLLCKARLDAVTEDDWPTIADLKTTQDASEQGFIRSIRRYRYDVQAAWYTHGYRVIHGKGITPNYLIVAVESEPPHGVNVFDMAEWVHFGQVDFERVLRQYAKCMETDEWPGYPTEIVAPEIPRYVSDQYEGGE